MRLIYLILAAGVVVTLSFMLYAGEPGTPTWWVLFVPFAAWAAVPYAALGIAVWKLLGRPWPLRVAGLAAAVMAGFGAFALYMTIVVEQDAQSGLVFLFLPVWQTLLCLPFLGLALILERRKPGA